jgi:hypothetical protein
MKDKTKVWFHRLAAAFIGGGASAVTSGLTAMGFASDKFNLNNVNGVFNVLGLAAANFVVSGFLSAMFYLRQSPLPPEPTGDSNPSAFTRLPIPKDDYKPDEPQAPTGN